MRNTETKLFITRERVRRELINTKPGETVCLNHEQVRIVLEWLKELEKEVSPKKWKT